MAVYKFRVTFEDYEDVYREIEIKSTQTFEDFHKAIQAAIGFDGKQLASFYMSNDTWRKGREITLMDMSEEGEVEPKVIMSKSRLADFIEDPHQKIIYVFDFMAFWSFYVELVKILPDNPATKYPVCVKTVGAAPKQYKDKKLPDPLEEEEEEPKSRKKAGVYDVEHEYGIDSGDEDLDGFGEEESDDMGGSFNDFEEQ